MGLKRICDLCGTDMTEADMRSRVFRRDDVEVEVRLLRTRTGKDVCLRCQVQVVGKGDLVEE